MDRKIRIGMLISRYYPYQGGAEIQCRRLSKEIAGKNNDIFILTHRLKGSKSQEKIDNLPVYRVGMPFSGRIGSLSYIIKGFSWLQQNKDKFDILHAHLAGAPAVLAGLSAIRLKKPSVIKLGGSRKTGDIGTSLATPHGKAKLGFLSKRINCFVCPSGEIREELIGNGFPKDRITVIPNGVDTALFRPSTPEEKASMRAKLGLSADAKIAVFSGRFEPGKGIELLLNAWTGLERELKKENIFLVLLGSGSLEQGFKKEFGALNTVQFAGWRPNTDEYLKAADIFILPSLGEGMPNSLLEAMSCGLICLSTKIGGIVEIIRNGENGILFEPGNAESIRSSLKSAFSDISALRALGTKARSYVEGNLSMPVIAGKYMELYGRLV